MTVPTANMMWNMTIMNAGGKLTAMDSHDTKVRASVESSAAGICMNLPVEMYEACEAHAWIPCCSLAVPAAKGLIGISHARFWGYSLAPRRAR